MRAFFQSSFARACAALLIVGAASATHASGLDSGNKYRADAHAKSLTTDQFRAVMPQLVWLMKCFEENS